MKNPAPKKLYALSLVGSPNHIISTKEHPFFVKGKGYIPVSEIVPGDIVYACKTGYSRFCSVPWRMRRNDRNEYARKAAEVRKTRRDILPGLCSQTSFGANEEEQPHVRSGNTGKNDSIAEKKRNSSSRIGRKRSRINKGNKNFLLSLARARLVARAGNSYGNKRARRANELQGGHCEYLVWHCDRGRRGKSQRSSRTGGGRSQRCFLKSKGWSVLRFMEQGSINGNRESESGNFVFNLEVEGNHNYFAGDVLVHNCEEAQSFPSFLGDTDTDHPKAGSEIWVSFNPLLADDPTTKLFLTDAPPPVPMFGKSILMRTHTFRKRSGARWNGIAKMTTRTTCMCGKDFPGQSATRRFSAGDSRSRVFRTIFGRRPTDYFSALTSALRTTRAHRCDRSCTTIVCMSNMRPSAMAWS